jgi:hypothetical protein
MKDVYKLIYLFLLVTSPAWVCGLIWFVLGW